MSIINLLVGIIAIALIFSLFIKAIPAVLKVVLIFIAIGMLISVARGIF